MRPLLHHVLVFALTIAAIDTCGNNATAQIPVYEIHPIASYSVTTTLRGASQSGDMVGYQILNGQIVPIVVTPGAGIRQLPLPPGSTSGFANDVNSSGVIVGAVGGNFPFDTGEPAIWTPAPGGWTVTVPQQFATLPSPLGTLQVQGGQAVAVNENGVIVGWSRYRGFQGGPTTQFFVNAPPIDLRARGFDATVTGLSDTTDLIVGADLRMDLTTGVVTNLGVPTGNFGFATTLAYSINDAGQTIAAAQRSTSLPEKYLSFRHTDAGGWVQHNPAALPSVFIGFYDNNNRGDVVASGGVWFEAEGVLSPLLRSLLDPAFSLWTVSLGFIADDRRIFTTAIDPNGTSWFVTLVPKVCQQSLGFQGPGAATATLCGTGLGRGQQSDYIVTAAPPSSLGAISLSAPGQPDVSLFGGTAVSFGSPLMTPVLTDVAGNLTVSLPGLPPPAIDLVMQSVFLDPSLPQGVAFTNALMVHIGG